MPWYCVDCLPCQHHLCLCDCCTSDTADSVPDKNVAFGAEVDVAMLSKTVDDPLAPGSNFAWLDDMCHFMFLVHTAGWAYSAGEF